MKLTAALFIAASVVASVTSETTENVSALPKGVGIVYLIPVFQPGYYEGTKNGDLSNDIDAELPGKAIRIPAFLLAIPTKKHVDDAESEDSTPKRIFHSRHRRATHGGKGGRGGGHSGGGGGSGGGEGFGGGGGRGLAGTGCQSSSSSSSSSFGSGRGVGGGGGGGVGGGLGRRGF